MTLRLVENRNESYLSTSAGHLLEPMLNYKDHARDDDDDDDNEYDYIKINPLSHHVSDSSPISALRACLLSLRHLVHPFHLSRP